MREIRLLLEQSRWEKTNESSFRSRSLLFVVFLLLIIPFLVGVKYNFITIQLFSFTIAISGLFYYIIYSRFAIPISLAVLSSVLLIPIFHLSINVGVLLYFSLLILLLCVFLDDDILISTVIPSLFLLSVLFYMIFSTQLVGVDEVQFYERVTDFSSTSEYFSHLVALGQNNLLSLRSSIQTFPLFYLPFYQTYNLSSSKIIVIINSTLWMTTAFLFRELLLIRRSEQNAVSNISPNLVFAILMLSPSAIYWTSSFAKDITSVFLCVLATYLFFRKRFILFIIVLIFATSIRAYSIAIIGIYIAVTISSPLLLGLGVIGSILFVLMYTSSPMAIFNSLLVWGYFFLSPNPANIENWTNFELFPRMVEGIILTAILILSIVHSSVEKHIAKQYVLLGVALFIYALVMITIGYRNHVLIRGHTYGIGVVGDNVLRKMLPMLPVLSIWIAQTVSIQKEYFPEIKFN